MDEQTDLQNNPFVPEVPLDPLPDINIPSIRTYKGDINQTVNQDKITTAKILMAEQRAKNKQHDIDYQTDVSKPKNMFALIFGIIFVVAALGLVGVFGYQKIIKQTPAATFTAETFFLFAFDKQVYVDIQKSKSEVLALVDTTIQGAQSNKDNTYTDIIFFKTDTNTNTKSRLSSTEFFQLYEVKLPNVISRSISKDFVYGLYKTGIRVEPFIVIGLSDYENAFGAMFDWEKTLALDVREFFPNLQEIFNATANIPLITNPVPSDTISTSTATSSKSNATSTAKVVTATSTVRTSATSTATSTATTTIQATSTEVNIPVINRNVSFVDVVLSNKDTRAVRDENGTPYFYYAFIDKDKILFAQDPKLITEIVRKIKEKQLVR